MGKAQLIPEPLNGGLVTVRDPALLSPGELAQANNAVYLPSDPSIHKVKGRTKYNSVAITGAGTVKGLRYCEFDAGDNYLLAHTNDDINTSIFSAETGTFSLPASLTDVGSGATLDAVHNENRYVLLIGNTANYVFNANGTARKHGLNPVTGMPTGSDTGAPTLISGNFNASLNTGFFHFLTTEVVDDGINPPIESTFIGSPGTASTAMTTPSSNAYQITRPVLVNSTATKWRIYMAGPTTDPKPVPTYNEFRLVGEQDIGNTTFIVGNTGGTAAKFPTTNTTIVAGWSIPDNAHTDNNTGARCSTDGATQDYQTFGISGITGTVTGIEIFVKVRIPDYTPLKRSPVIFLQISPDNGVTFFPSTARYFEVRKLAGTVDPFGNVNGDPVAGYTLCVQGNPKDLWGKSSWSSTELNDTNFRVRLRYGLANTFAGATNAIADVDYIQVRVSQFISGSTAPSVNLQGTPFRTVNVSVAGVTSTVGADGPPPVATTGDIFEGQLVTNDITDQSIIRYSLPGYIESFPSIYFLNFETKVQDFVTCIRRLGNKLVVGLKQQLYRINYLPRETDAEFDRGRAYEAISETEGIVGTQASCLFSPDGGPLYLAYISHAGPRYTDGFQTFPLTHDLDWPATVRLPSAGDIVNYLSSCILVNYPLNSQLWLYYTPPGQTSNTKALVFHYSSDHRKEGGGFKVTGPIDVAAASAVNARLAGNDVLMTGQASGFTFIEDRGYTHNAGGTIAFSVKSREMYVAGPGATGTLESLFIKHQQDATSTVTVTPATRFKDDAQVSQTAKTFTTAQAGLARQFFHLNFESVQWTLSEPGADGGTGVRVSGLVMNFGETGLPERTT